MKISFGCKTFDRGSIGMLAFIPIVLFPFCFFAQNAIYIFVNFDGEHFSYLQEE
jgi:hypothetical protein